MNIYMGMCFFNLILEMNFSFTWKCYHYNFIFDAYFVCKTQGLLLYNISISNINNANILFTLLLKKLPQFQISQLISFYNFFFSYIESLISFYLAKCQDCIYLIHCQDVACSIGFALKASDLNSLFHRWQDTEQGVNSIHLILRDG